jgi:hypothetical protein
MFSSTLHDQPILEISQRDSIAITVDAFLFDRQAGKISKITLTLQKSVFHHAQQGMKRYGECIYQSGICKSTLLAGSQRLVPSVYNEGAMD